MSKTFNKIIISIGIVLLISQSVFSQISVGYKYGLCYPTGYFETGYYDSLFSISSQAIVIEIFTQKYVGSRIEVGTNTSGWHRISRLGVEDRRILNCVEIPYLAKGSVGYKGVRLVAEAGIYGSYALSGSQTAYANGKATTTNIVWDTEKDNRLLYGLMGGGGLEVRSKFAIVTAEVRVSNGLRDAYKSYETYNTQFSVYRNYEGMVSVAVPIFRKNEQAPKL